MKTAAEHPFSFTFAVLASQSLSWASISPFLLHIRPFGVPGNRNTVHESPALLALFSRAAIVFFVIFCYSIPTHRRQ